MVVNPKAGAPGEVAGEAIHAAIRKFNHQAAPVADEVVSMNGLDPGVPPVAMLHVDGPDQVQAGQEFHRTIDARQTDSGHNPPGPPMDLGHPEVS
jgi:hypothetical protein